MNLSARAFVVLSTRHLVILSTRPLVGSYLCPLFSITFNIMAALFIHQPPALSQKIDSRGGLF